MKRLRKRICGAGILFLMMILALGTMVSFAEEGDTSYKLTIQKIFAKDTPDGAMDRTYTFRVEAQVSGSDDPVEKTVRIKGEGSEVISFDNAFKISVIEQTDDGGFTGPDGNEWDVVNTYCESSMHVGASQATVNISRDGGMIRVTRPADVPTVTFRLTGKPFHGETEMDYGIFTVEADKTVELGTKLPQGQYTITKLRSADGFSVLVGKRSFHVDAGQEGVVHINGNIEGSDSRISIKAPDAGSDGSKKTHYYNISNRSGSVSRDIDVESGKIGIVDHLPEGEYTIKVSKTYNGIEGYSVTVPVTTCLPKTKYGTGMSFTSTAVRKYFVIEGDYIDNLTYGPLYDKAGKRLPETVTYQFSYGVIDPDKSSSSSVYIKGWSLNKIAKASVAGYSVNLDSTPIVKEPPQYPKEPYDKRLYIGTKNVSDSNAAQIKVTWDEYTKSESTKEINRPDPEGNTVEIDERGYIILSKPEDPTPRGGEVFYYYTITDSNGAKITNFTVTDKDGKSINVPINTDDATVILKAGQSVKINGLHAGNFTIIEKVQSAPEMGFDVTLEDTEKRVTTPEGTIEIETLGERTVEISRPGKPEDDNHRQYTYNIYESGKAEPIRTITLESGQKTTVAEATDGTKLPAGKYRIEAADDKIVGFDVTYSDSSSLTSDYIKEAAVTFTNYFKPITASYHVVHEYYLRNADGSYTFEGASPIYTKNCDGNHDENGGHTSKGLHQLNLYKGNEYTHISEGGDAYGKVVSWTTGSEEKDVTKVLQQGDIPPDEGYRFVRKGSSNSGEDESGYIRYQYSYMPVTNQTFAKARDHEEADEKGADIIILRYYRDDTEEHGTYNIIHEYYRRTSQGDVWEGSSELSIMDVGRLTSENRYHTYDARSVNPILRFTPTKGDAAGSMEYPYVYDSAAYGRIVTSGNIANNKPGHLEGDKVYLTDTSMNNVQATEAGDQIIILRYYRGGGYKVVHEYYYREAANFEGDSGETEEDSSDTAGENPEGGAAQAAYSKNNLQQEGENTTADQNTVSGNNPPEAENVIDNNPPETKNVSDATSPGAGKASGDNQPEARVFSIIPPRQDSYGTNTVQNAENSVSDNNPQGTGDPSDTAQDGKNDISGNNPQNADGTADAAQNEKENAVTAKENAELEAYGIMALDEEENSFNGTLTNEGGYVYEFEGSRKIVSYSADLESRHDARGVRKENLFPPAGDEQHLYTFKDAVYGYIDEDNPDAYRVAPYMMGVTATSKEDEIIILRYIRGDGVKEPEPEPPTPENPPGGGGGGGSNPPPEDPEIPEIPDLPTELPDPNDPDSPDRITILEDGVPRTYVKVWDFDKQEWVYIPEEDVPLWKTSPQTADVNTPGFWFVLAAASFGGIVLLRSAPRKKR